MTEKVWEARLDNRYEARVDRLSPRTGRLFVIDTTNGKTLVDRVVGLSYGAQYGPDVDDVDEWQRIAEAAVARPAGTPTDYLWPPNDWTPTEAAYGLAARHYWRIKAAELGNMAFDVETPMDLASELTLVSSYLRPLASNAKVDAWILETGNAWLVDRAREHGVVVGPCEGFCKRVTARDDRGRFLCVPCERQAAKATRGEHG